MVREIKLRVKGERKKAMLGYKLTDQEGYTRRGAAGETLWRVGETVSPTGEGSDPCGPGVLHDYSSPLLAALLNPIHADISEPRLFELEHTGTPQTDGLKRWTSGTVKVLRELPLPQVSTAQRVRFAMLVSLYEKQSDRLRRHISWQCRETCSQAGHRGSRGGLRRARRGDETMRGFGRCDCGNPRVNGQCIGPATKKTSTEDGFKFPRGPMSDDEVAAECKRFASAWSRELLKASAHDGERCAFSQSWDYRTMHPADLPSEQELRDRYLAEMKRRNRKPSKAAYDWQAYAELQAGR